LLFDKVATKNNFMINSMWRFLPVFSIVFFLTILLPNINAQDLDGAKLYRSNCSSCHDITDRLTGPPLKGARERAPEGDWIYSWVKNSSKVIQSGDAYAVKIYKEYNETKMQAFPALSNEEIDAILDYADNWTPPVKSVANIDAGDGAKEESNSKMYIIIAWVVIVLLVIGVIQLARVVNEMDIIVAADEDEKEDALLKAVKNLKESDFSYLSILKDRRVMIPSGIIIFCFVASGVWDFQTNLGRQQGYAPEQPIAFSHKVHAGINKIDCQYCHSGARKGKSAVIPSLNVCMNCHKAIDKYDGGELWNGKDGTAEIHKIYEHIGWDSEKRRFKEGAETKNIEWTRIHNLPDHVYFNHAQHVNAGKVECQTCHGPVEEMDVLKQHAPLSMGWCINCHRETEVQFDNEYYEHYEQFHQELSSGERKKVTVEHIGGTECQKCHY
jgi:cytochrome c2